MTFSIVARAGAAYGVAVASKYLAVGAVVPAAEVGLGALATQSYANPAHRPQALTLLRTGVDAAGVVAGLTAADPQRSRRQLGVVSPTGDGATYTGEECHDWAGGEAGDGWAIQGNLLVGSQVLAAMCRAWQGGDAAQPLAQRLLAVLTAGDLAGGDRRGRQSAALVVVTPERTPAGGCAHPVDLRVDDHRDPLGELARLLDLHSAGEKTGTLARESARLWKD